MSEATNEWSSEMSNEFYTLTTLGTLAGATGATVAVTNALKVAFDLNPKWLGLLIAEIVCLGILMAIGPTRQSDWFIAVLNGCLVFTTAAGATTVGAAATGNIDGTASAGAARSGNVQTERPGPAAKAKRSFWSPWL
jgi:hypothetical protein